MSLTPLWVVLANYRASPASLVAPELRAEKAESSGLKKAVSERFRATFLRPGRTSCGWFVRNGWAAGGHKILCPARILHCQINLPLTADSCGTKRRKPQEFKGVFALRL